MRASRPGPDSATPVNSMTLRLVRSAALAALCLLTATCSTDKVIGPPPASTLSFSLSPAASSTAGATFAPAVQVEARDASGNLVTRFTGNVTIAILAGTGTPGATLGGTKTVPAVRGVATFATLRIDKAGTGYTLTATAPGLSSATSTAFAITPGPAAALAFTVALPAPPAAAATAGAALTPAVQVTARDAEGNTATDFTGSVTLALGANPSSATLSGSTTVAAVTGAASFTTLSVDKTGTGYTLVASSGTLATATSTPFAITAGAASQLAFTAPPTTAVAGATLAPAVQVTALDALGNAVTGFTGTVHVAITAGTGTSGATLTGVTSVAASAGVATFATLRIDKTGMVKTATGYTLSATATGLGAGTSDPFDITPGAAARLVFTIPPSGGTAGAPIAPPLRVTAQDALGNVVPSFAGAVTLAIGTNPAAGTLSGTATASAVLGVAAFASVRIDKAGGGYTLVASTPGGSIAGASSTPFAIAPGPATGLTFTTQPMGTTAGAAIAPAVQVTARDAQGNVATGFNGNVTIAIAANPSGGTLAGTRTVAAVDGVATFATLRIDTSGTGYTLAVAAPGLAGATSAAFDIAPSTVVRLAFTQPPATTTAGAAMAPAVQVTARDASGNTVSSFTGTVTVALGATPVGGTLSGTARVAAVAGVATFSSLSVDKAGTGYTLVASATGLTDATSAPFAVTPGAAALLAFTEPPSAASAGGTITPQVEVTARDAQGNTATGFTGAVTLAIGTNPGSGTLSGTTTVAAVAGVAAFATLSIDKPGTGYTLTATASGPPPAAATSPAFDISAAPVARLVFTADPASTTAGATLSPAVQVTAQDGAGGTLTGFTGTVTLAITAGTGTSGAALSGTATVAAIGGVATFSALKVNRAGIGYRLSATAPAGGFAGATSAVFNVAPGAAAQLVFVAQPPNAAAGAALVPAVQVAAQDAQGNAVPGYGGSVTVQIAPGTGNGAGTLSGTLTVAAVTGLARFSDLSVDRSGVGYALLATAPGVSAAQSAPFSVAAGAASEIAFTVQPSTAPAGVALTPALQVTARDAQGNIATGFTATVTVALGANPAGGTLSGTASVAATGGVATFSDLSLDKAGSGYTLVASVVGGGAGGPAAVTSAAFGITGGAATQLAFTLEPSRTAAGGTIKPAVRAAALDAFGNTATGFFGNVTVALGANPGNGTLSGSRTFAAIAGVATFPPLSIDSVGTGYTLTATAPGSGLTGATSTPFDVIPATATQLFFSVQPRDSQTAGSVIVPALQVSVRDASGNTVTGYTGNVTLAITAGTGIAGAVLSGTATVPAAGGVATFSDLSLDKSEAWYRLSASAGGVPPITSASFRVVSGAATRLGFRVQPSTATAGAIITPRIEVTAQDALGNTATGFGGPVTMAIGTNPAGGTLSGTTSVPAVAGVASFLNLSIGQAGTGYRLAATAGGPTGATSAPFGITATRATQLAFTVAPTSTTAGRPISPAVQVVARDAAGQTDASFTGDVTLSITAGTGNRTGALSGVTTVAAVAGVATFAALDIDTAGTGYKLSATAPGVAGTTSPAFSIDAGAPARLSFDPQRTLGPNTSAWPAGTAMPAAQVTARDSLGNAVAGFTGDVTVSIAVNPGGGTLSGTTTVSALGGVTTFSDLSIERTGSGYELRADGAGLSPAGSDAFIISAGPATSLLFTVQPSSAPANAIIRPAVRVAALDALGNVATGFTGSVTLAITGGTGTNGATLAGLTTVAVVNGVATFSNLSVDKPGTGYTLTATATGLAAGASTAFDVN